jgi:hypothetical protein
MSSQGRWRNLVKEGVVQSRGWQRPRLSDVEGWDNSQPKRVTGSAITKCPFPRPEDVVQGRVGYLLPLGRGGTIPGTIPAKGQRGAP